MLSSKDIVPIAIFIVVVYLFSKLIISTKEEPESLENGGGLVALTDTSKLLVTDDTGNLSTYTPATEGFKTNDLKVTGASTFSGEVNATGGIKSTTGTFSNQLCIGSTCISEQQLSQLVRNDNAVDEKPSVFYNRAATNLSTLIFKQTMNVATLGYSVVETIVNGNLSVRIQQNATQILWDSHTSEAMKDVSSAVYTRYSLGNHATIKADATKDAWSKWEIWTPVVNTKELNTGKLTTGEVNTKEINMNNWKITNKAENGNNSDDIMFHYTGTPGTLDRILSIHSPVGGNTGKWIRGVYAKSIGGTLSELVKHGDPIDLATNTGYVLAGQAGNYTPDSYATYRGRSASDAFIIQKTNNSGRAREALTFPA